MTREDDDDVYYNDDGEQTRETESVQPSTSSTTNDMTLNYFINNMDTLLQDQNQRYFLKLSPATSLNDTITYQVIPTSAFQGQQPNFDAFKRHKKSTEAFHFENLNKDAILVVPKPHSGKNFLSIYDFLKNASQTQKDYLKKEALIAIRKGLDRWGQVYVNTHGLGVPYFHLRIDKTPKYYH